VFSVHVPRSVPQESSAGDSCPEIHAAALVASEPRTGLSWLDIGCGRGGLLRTIRRDLAPTRLAGVDILDWLAADLRDEVVIRVGPAESALAQSEPADRVLMIETIEHLEAPWTVLREAARLVLPSGMLVVSTPNITTLRHRIELVASGHLTSFRPDNTPHLTPILPHVVARIMEEEGLMPLPATFAARDILPRTGGKLWPLRLHQRMLRLSSVSVIMRGRRRD
jgi:2-polyprenyl-3-methyl-5-hydroxy-6-metoxy-1,4-benzoquinol methylase